MVRRLLVSLVFLVLLAGCAVRQESAVRSLPVNGVEIGYHVKGQGDPLLMIMGYAGTMDVWDPALVDALAKQYQVIVFDNRNVGRSTTSSDTVTMQLMADDALGLLDALGIEKAHVLGWSMGTVIAQEMAFKRPGAVGKLVLYGSACEREPVMDALKRFDGLTPEQFAALLFPRAWVAQHPDIYSRLPSPAIPAMPEAIERQRQALNQWGGSVDRLPGLNKEVLLMVGEDDAITPLAQSEKMAGLISGAWLVRYKGAGHWLMYQNPEGMASTIREFLESRQDLLAQ